MAGRKLCFWEGGWDGTWTPTGCMSQAAFFRQQRDPDVEGLDPSELARIRGLGVGRSVAFNFGAGGFFRVKRVK